MQAVQGLLLLGSSSLVCCENEISAAKSAIPLAFASRSLRRGRMLRTHRGRSPFVRRRRSATGFRFQRPNNSGYRSPSRVAVVVANVRFRPYHYKHRIYADQFRRILHSYLLEFFFQCHDMRDMRLFFVRGI